MVECLLLKHVNDIGRGYHVWVTAGTVYYFKTIICIKKNKNIWFYDLFKMPPFYVFSVNEKIIYLNIRKLYIL